MKLRKQEQGLVKTDLPHYYTGEDFYNHPNGIPQKLWNEENLTTSGNVSRMGHTMEKIYLPHPPQTVDVPYVKVFLTWSYL